MAINLKNSDIEKAYATARHAVLPLLFKGDDFAKTDIDPA